jgi:hypothetical protein
VDHKCKDSHLGSTSLVELNSTLAQLGLSIEGVPAKVKGAVAEVTNESPPVMSFMTASSRKPMKAMI